MIFPLRNVWDPWQRVIPDDRLHWLHAGIAADPWRLPCPDGSALDELHGQNGAFLIPIKGMGNLMGIINPLNPLNQKDPYTRPGKRFHIANWNVTIFNR